MNSSIFVNEFLNKGFNDLLNGISEYAFEKHIAQCLVDICGLDELKDAFNKKDENAFYNIVTDYGDMSLLYDRLISTISEFQSFNRDNKVNKVKNDLGSYIEITLIKIFLKKCIKSKAILQRVPDFENHLLKDPETIRWHLEHSKNPNRTKEEWLLKKRILTDEVKLTEIKPEYLEANIYSRFGIKLEEVKKMDYRMVNELNTYIKNQLSNSTVIRLPKDKNQSILNTTLTSGNGFVDALLIVSIIVTELSVGFIYLFLHL